MAWIRRYILFHGKRHPDEMGETAIGECSDIRTIQTLLGHRDVSTSMIYTHILRRRPLGVQSPLDHPP